MKKRGLGRGLDVLLGVVNHAREQGAGMSSAFPEGSDATPENPQAAPESRLRQIAVDRIQRGRYQPRLEVRPETLEDLAASIRVQGVIQPVVLRPIGDHRYELLAGERRWRASQLAGLTEIPAVIREVSDIAALAIALIENIQRENLNPVEEARALQRLVEEFELTHEEAAQAVGRSRTSVSNLLRLLSLQPEVRAMLENGDLEMGHARALLALEAREHQIDAARTVTGQGLSVRETEMLVRALLTPTPASAEKSTTDQTRGDPNIRRLQEELAERLGASVAFHHGARGKGRVIIQYNSLDELDGILAHIK